MVDGLREIDPTTQTVDMQTFGKEVDGMCYGCAATWTIQKLAGRRLASKELNGLAEAGTMRGDEAFEDLPWYASDIDLFEDAIDEARKGFLSELFEFMGCDTDQADLLVGRFFMTNDNWEAQLPKVEELIAELESLNL